MSSCFKNNWICWPSKSCLSYFFWRIWGIFWRIFDDYLVLCFGNLLGDFIWWFVVSFLVIILTISLTLFKTVGTQHALDQSTFDFFFAWNKIILVIIYVIYLKSLYFIIVCCRTWSHKDKPFLFSHWELLDA